MPGARWSAFAFTKLSDYQTHGQQRCLCCHPTKQFFTSNSLAAHLGGGRGSQGGVPVTEGPKVSGFQGFGEGNPKVLDTVTGGDLDGTARSHTLAAAELLDSVTHKFCYRPIIRYCGLAIMALGFLVAGFGAGLDLLIAGGMLALFCWFLDLVINGVRWGGDLTGQPGRVSSQFCYRGLL